MPRKQKKKLYRKESITAYRKRVGDYDKGDSKGISTYRKKVGDID